MQFENDDSADIEAAKKTKIKQIKKAARSAVLKSIADEVRLPCSVEEIGGADSAVFCVDFGVLGELQVVVPANVKGCLGELLSIKDALSKARPDDEKSMRIVVNSALHVGGSLLKHWDRDRHFSAARMPAWQKGPRFDSVYLSFVKACSIARKISGMLSKSGISVDFFFRAHSWCLEFDSDDGWLLVKIEPRKGLASLGGCLPFVQELLRIGNPSFSDIASSARLFFQETTYATPASGHGASVHVFGGKKWIGKECLDFAILRKKTQVREIEFAEGVERIAHWAFGTMHLVRVALPKSIRVVGELAFAHCSNLSIVTFAGTMEEWRGVSKGRCAFHCIDTKSVECSDGTTSIS